MTQGVRLLSVMTQNNRFEEATLSVIAVLNDAKKVNYPSPEIFGSAPTVVQRQWSLPSEGFCNI